jgi:hypothetical protein
MRFHPAALVGLLILAHAWPTVRAADVRTIDTGAAIYLQGVLGSGAPLVGERPANGTDTRGGDAACVNCHQRSGLGTTEGRILIPPITGRYLFHSRAAHSGEDVLPYVESMHGNRDPYTDATLARAIREGLDSEGRPLNTLMPRFALKDGDMKALIGYLKQLEPRRVPGVADGVAHFATVFTADADPVKRQGVLDVLQRYVIDKNEFPFGPSPAMHASGKTAYGKSMYMANLRWQLHVWDLSGPANTWKVQLEQHLQKEPVLAVLSGLGASNWRPVHEFCENNAVPCLFPNAEVPVDSENDFYSLYFSKGVLLEAQLAAGRIAQSGNPQRVRVLEQIYRAGDSGEPAARALKAQLAGKGINVRNRALAPRSGREALAHALHEASDVQALVLWLRPDDLAALGEPPAGPTLVVMSGLMGGLERAPLPARWRDRTIMTYPFDLPDKRGVRIDYPLGWFYYRHIPVVDEQVQSDTFLACSLVSKVMHDMADALDRPYLIEQLRDSLDHRLITGYYPRLSLAVRQRFASKGGYLARFADGSGPRLLADSAWIVPDTPASRTVVSTR